MYDRIGFVFCLNAKFLIMSLFSYPIDLRQHAHSKLISLQLKFDSGGNFRVCAGRRFTVILWPTEMFRDIWSSSRSTCVLRVHVKMHKFLLPVGLASFQCALLCNVFVYLNLGKKNVPFKGQQSSRVFHEFHDLGACSTCESFCDSKRCCIN